MHGGVGSGRWRWTAEANGRTDRLLGAEASAGADAEAE